MTLEDLDRLLPAVLAQYREARPPTQRAIDLTIADLREDDRPTPAVTDTRTADPSPTETTTMNPKTTSKRVGSALPTSVSSPNTPGPTKSDQLRESFSAQLTAALALDGRSPEVIALATWGPQHEEARPGSRYGKLIREAIKRGWWNPDDLADLACELGLEVSLVFREATK